jgi:hypothetical protein
MNNKRTTTAPNAPPIQIEKATFTEEKFNKIHWFECTANIYCDLGLATSTVCQIVIILNILQKMLRQEPPTFL